MPINATAIDPRIAWDADEQAVYLGAIITTVTTGVFFLLPIVLPAVLGDPRAGDDLGVLRITGGLIGGGVSGVLTKGIRRSGMRNGIKAGIYGLVLVLVLFVLFNVLVAVTSGSPPAVLVIFGGAIVFAIPLMVSHTVGGMIGGALGRLIRKELLDTPP